MNQKQEFIAEYRKYHELLREELIPSKMMPLFDKSTRKLELRNLEKHVEKLQFDLEIEENSIFKSINLIRSNIQQLKESSTLENINIVKEGIEQFRQENVLRFDQFFQKEQQLDQEIENYTQFLPSTNKSDEMIEEEDFQEFSDQEIQENKTAQSFSSDPITRVQEIDRQLKILSGGREKWLDSDHNQFIKIFNKYRGNEQKVVKECVETLALNNMVVLEHLEQYERYLELNEEKKVLTAQYKKNKNLKQQQQQKLKEEKQKRQKEEELKKRQAAIAEQERKKQLIKEYKQRKMSEDKSVKEVDSRKELLSKEKKRQQSLEKRAKVEEIKNFKIQGDKRIKELEAKVKAMIKQVPKPKK